MELLIRALFIQFGLVYLAVPSTRLLLCSILTNLQHVPHNNNNNDNIYIEQERLLLSILPKHLAKEIRQDLGAVVQGQFHKIYMSRHENVR